MAAPLRRPLGNPCSTKAPVTSRLVINGRFGIPDFDNTVTKFHQKLSQPKLGCSVLFPKNHLGLAFITKVLFGDFCGCLFLKAKNTPKITFPTPKITYHRITLTPVEITLMFWQQLCSKDIKTMQSCVEQSSKMEQNFNPTMPLNPELQLNPWASLPKTVCMHACMGLLARREIHGPLCPKLKP